MLLDGFRGRAGEADVSLLEAGGLEVRRSKPEERIGPGESPVDHVGVTMRTLDDFNPFAGTGWNLRSITDDHADLLAALDDAFKYLVADGACGRGDDDHK